VSAPRVFTRPEETGEVLAGWTDLVAAADWSSYFMSPAWTLSWWETLGREQTAELAVWQADGVVDAVVGLARVRSRLHPRLPGGVRQWVALGAGAGAADHVGWVTAPHRADDVRRWLGDHLGRAPVLLAGVDPDADPRPVLPGLRRVATTPCPRVDLGDGPLPTGSTKLRKAVRYDERRLAGDGVELTWSPPGEVTPDVLDALLRLHATRADGQGWASTFTSQRRRLHLALTARATAAAGPAAVVARRGDEVVGVLYGFRWGATFAYYQTGWDPALARLGLGTVLVAAAMRHARDDGCRVFDFLRGAEPYKYRFGAVDRVDDTWLLPTGPGGALLRAKYQVSARRAARA
jgi:CelD/BcsL family acetyltransferase involved in cellulose biosynthesis